MARWREADKLIWLSLHVSPLVPAAEAAVELPAGIFPLLLILQSMGECLWSQPTLYSAQHQLPVTRSTFWWNKTIRKLLKKTTLTTQTMRPNTIKSYFWKDPTQHRLQWHAYWWMSWCCNCNSGWLAEEVRAKNRWWMSLGLIFGMWGLWGEAWLPGYLHPCGPAHTGDRAPHYWSRDPKYDPRL